MKKLFIIYMAFACLPAIAQKMDQSKVPAAVKSAFSTNFSEITNATWEKEHGNYEANFSQGGKKMSVTYDGKGTLLEAETEMAISQLPASVAAYIEKNYAGQKIKHASAIKMSNGTLNFEAEVNGKDLIFDRSGKFIKESKD